MIEERSDWLNVPHLGTLKKYIQDHNGYIAGGAFKQVILGEKPKDLDIFFRNSVDYKVAVDHYEALGFKKLYENENCVSYVDKDTGAHFELIKAIFGEPEEVLESFDFTVSKFAFAQVLDSNEDEEFKIYHHEKFFEHLMLKRLVLDDKIPFPINTFERILRYESYGFKLCRESKEKILKAIQASPAIESIDLSDSLYNGMD